MTNKETEHTVCILVHPKGVRSVALRSLQVQATSSTPNLAIDVFLELALCTGPLSRWNRFRPLGSSESEIVMLQYKASFKMVYLQL